MKTICKEIFVECDVRKEGGFCWVEDSAVISLRDFHSKGHQILRKSGWVIGKKDICPYCSKGITKFNTVEDKSYPNKKGF